ncbi:MAG: hypothetical protein PHC33_03420 [Candidatus Omnitrophica bacterium]|nr:hypothetical protein [Candidatus Omnitrophota bacterium]
MATRKSQVIFLSVLVPVALVFWALTGLKTGVISRSNISSVARRKLSGNTSVAGSPLGPGGDRKDPRCTIAGISYNKTNPLTVIGKNAYVPGDSVCGGVITGINRERVMVKFRREEKVFMIGDTVAE